MYIPSPSVSLQVGMNHYVIAKWHLHPTMRIETIIDLELGILGKGSADEQIMRLIPNLVRAIVAMRHMSRERVPGVDTKQDIRPRLEEVAISDGKRDWKKFKEEASKVSFLVNMMTYLIAASAFDRYKGGTSAGFQVSELSFGHEEDDEKLSNRLTGWISQGLVSWLEQSKLVTKR